MGAKNCTLSVFPAACRVIMRAYNRLARSLGDMFEMSGARSPSVIDPIGGDPDSIVEASAAGGSCARKPRPASMANKERSAIAATAHGKGEAGTAFATCIPHLWQNLAPALRGAPHPLQAAPESGAPHSAQ